MKLDVSFYLEILLVEQCDLQSMLIRTAITNDNNVWLWGGRDHMVTTRVFVAVSDKA